VFNLIVSGTLGNGGREGSMSTSRVLEHTHDEIAARFAPGGALDIPAVQRLPTIFMTEGHRDEVVTVGWIARLRLGSIGRQQEYRFDYRRDSDVQPMTNAELFDIAEELGMTEWEFSRNHWAIKDVNLFEILFRHQASKLPRPKVFALSEKPIVPNRVSIMMPFGHQFTAVYEAIKTEVEACGFTCHRADDFWENPHIMEDVVELLCTSRVVICDFSGRNPNVFYETGIAHMLGKDTILITQSGGDVPFDLSSQRYVAYLPNGEGIAKLANQLAERVRKITDERP